MYYILLFDPLEKGSFTPYTMLKGDVCIRGFDHIRDFRGKLN